MPKKKPDTLLDILPGIALAIVFVPVAPILVSGVLLSVHLVERFHWHTLIAISAGLLSVIFSLRWLYFFQWLRRAYFGLYICSAGAFLFSVGYKADDPVSGAFMSAVGGGVLFFYFRFIDRMAARVNDRAIES